MSTEKPSKNEEEYFAREEAARLRRLRAQEEAERIARERQSHHMRCPRCGATLHTESLHEIQVDRCPECHGVWLDHGELEMLMQHDDPGALRRVMSDLWHAVKRGRSPS